MTRSFPPQLKRQSKRQAAKGREISHQESGFVCGGSLSHKRETDESYEYWWLLAEYRWLLAQPGIKP
jgi:hypothetical protein